MCLQGKSRLTLCWSVFVLMKNLGVLDK